MMLSLYISKLTQKLQLNLLSITQLKFLILQLCILAFIKTLFFFNKNKDSMYY